MALLGHELGNPLAPIHNAAELLTRYGQTEDQQRALGPGFDAHVVKPVSLAALERVLAGG